MYISKKWIRNTATERLKTMQIYGYHILRIDWWNPEHRSTSINTLSMFWPNFIQYKNQILMKLEHVIFPCCKNGSDFVLYYGFVLSGFRKFDNRSNSFNNDICYRLTPIAAQMDRLTENIKKSSVIIGNYRE